MADNTSQTGTDTIATDDIGGVKHQRVKIEVGADGAAGDVHSGNPLPSYLPDATVSSSITAADAVVAAPAGDGTLRSGASTAGSLVALAAPGGNSAWVAEITGSWTGTIYFEGSLASTNGTDGNWVSALGRQSGNADTTLQASATANGVWRGNVSGFNYFRLRKVGGTGTASIVLRFSDGTGATFLNASIPDGLNMIGTVGAGPEPTAVTGTLTTSQATQNTPVAGGTVQAAVADGASSWSVFLSGTITGTTVLNFDGSGDGGTTWFPLTVSPKGSVSPLPVQNVPATLYAIGVSSYVGDATGLTHVRVRATTFQAGDTPGIRIKQGSKGNIMMPVAQFPIVGAAANGATYDATKYPIPAAGIDGTTIRIPGVTAKATQGAFGVTTQDLKDAGRNARVLRMDVPVLTTAAAVLMSLTEWNTTSGAVGATTTPAVVTTGKRLRVQSIMCTYVATATAGECKFELRANTSGVVAVGSPVVVSHVVGAGTPATAGSSQSEAIPIPDGLEFVAGTGIGITITGLGVTMAAAVAGYGKATIYAYEY